MTRRIIIGASKGGVAKSTTTANVAINLALRHKRVLILDADSQGNISDIMNRSYYRWTGKELNEPSSLMYALAKGDLTKATVKLSDYLYLIPCEMDFSNYPMFLIKDFISKYGKINKSNLNQFQQFSVSYLTKMMNRVEAKIKPDYVFCDIPPSADLFEESGLYYLGSHSNDLGYLFLVMQPQQHSYQGVQYFNDFANDFLQKYNLRYQVAGVLPVILQKRASSDNDIMRQAIKNYGSQIMMTPIPYRERIKRYSITGISIPKTKPRTFHDKDITKIYTHTTNELINRINKVNQAMKG